MRAGFGRMKMCHMIADSSRELLEMAGKIGVQHRWIQKAGTHREHFDICLAKRRLAVQCGAKEITVMETVRMTLARARQISVALSLIVLALCAVTARAADVSFTANLQNYTSSPAQVYLDVILVDCGVDSLGIPNLPLTASGVKSLAPQVLSAASDGSVSATITPNSDITCGNVTNGTHYRVEVRKKAGNFPDPLHDKLLGRNTIYIGPCGYTLNSGAAVLSPGHSPSSGCGGSFTVSINGAPLATGTTLNINGASLSTGTTISINGASL
jgi:hypothetical protein